MFLLRKPGLVVWHRWRRHFCLVCCTTISVLICTSMPKLERLIMQATIAGASNSPQLCWSKFQICTTVLRCAFDWLLFSQRHWEDCPMEVLSELYHNFIWFVRLVFTPQDLNLFWIQPFYYRVYALNSKLHPFSALQKIMKKYDLKISILSKKQVQSVLRFPWWCPRPSFEALTVLAQQSESAWTGEGVDRKLISSQCIRMFCIETPKHVHPWVTTVVAIIVSNWPNQALQGLQCRPRSTSAYF